MAEKKTWSKRRRKINSNHNKRFPFYFFCSFMLLKRKEMSLLQVFFFNWIIFEFSFYIFISLYHQHFSITMRVLISEEKKERKKKVSWNVFSFSLAWDEETFQEVTPLRDKIFTKINSRVERRMGLKVLITFPCLHAMLSEK